MVSKPRAVAYVDLTTLEENFKLIRSRVAPRVKVLCVVKTDAYGHGAVAVARRLEANDADYLGVASVDEGIELRESGIESPILLMGGILPWDDLETVFASRLTPVVYDFSTLRRIADYSGDFDSFNIHIKVDTGMGRLGFLPGEIERVIEMLNEMPQVCVEGLMSHFSLSENVNLPAKNQIVRFEELLGEFTRRGFKPEIAHMANSGAIANYPEARFDMVRAGIYLYGSQPGTAEKDALPVKQVMRLVSKIALIREFPPGYPLSYGGTYTTDKPVTKIAYIPFGYGDGFPRALSNKGSVLIREKRCSIVGRICMDWLLADVTYLENVAAEDEVILLGQGESDVISADEIAALADTIPYEILCGISKRVLRVYV